MKSIKFRITGTMPLMLNNPQTVNPFNEFTKKLKPLTSKRTKTDDDMLEIYKLKFLASLYTNSQGRYILPAEHIANALIAAAKEVVEYFGAETLLEQMDDDEIVSYLEDSGYEIIKH